MLRPAVVLRFRLGALLLAAGLTLPLFAQRYHFENLTTSDGLASVSVFKIDQDERGFMWFATSDGLSRFDGTTLTTFDVSTGLHDQRLYSMIRDREGNLWLGSERGASKFDGRRVSNYSSADGLGAGAVWDLAVDGFGNTWFATQAGGVSMYDGRRFRSHSVESGIADPYVCAILPVGNDRLWIGTREAGLYEAQIDEQGNLRVLRQWTTTQGLPGNYVSGLVLSKAGEIWVGTRTGGLARIEGARAVPVPSSDRGDTIFSLLLTRKGSLAVGTLGDGVSICDPPGFTACRTLSKRNGLPDDDVVSLFEDREGGLWIGTGLGVSRWAGDRFESFTDQDGISGRIYSVMVEGEDVAWVSTARGVTRLERMPGASRRVKATSIGPAEGLPRTDTWQVLRDRRGELWIGGTAGLCNYRPGSGCRMYTTADGLPSSNVYCIFEDHDGTLWIGTERGAARMRGDPRAGTVSFDSWGPAQGLATFGIYAIAQAPDDRVWIASSGGVSVFDGSKFRNYGASDGLGVETINDIAVLSDGSIWVATSGAGIARYDPKADARGDKAFRPLDAACGMPSPTVMSIAETPTGLVWLGTLRGVVAVDPQHADCNGRFVVNNFTRKDGLAGDENGSGAGIAVTSSGAIWFAQAAGVTHYTPAADEAAKAAPVTTIDSMTANGAFVYRAPFSSMNAQDGPTTDHPRLEPGSRDLAFEFRGVSLADRRNVRYQVFLEGYDAAWSAPQQAAFKEYTNLPPGTYAFRVRATDSSGVWGAPASIGFELAAPFRETRWFALLVTLLVAVALYFADKLRWHVAKQRQTHLESLVAARTAILEQRTAELEKANELIRGADRAKNQFLASMSHELRTPLNSILGFTGLLIERRDDVPSDRAIKFLGNAHHSAQHLLGLINDLLDISKIEAGRMEVHIDNVAIRPLVESTIETIQGFAAPRNIEVVASVADDLPLVKLDGVKVRQILYNLLSNAIKFSLTGGTVQLEVREVSAERSPTLTDAIEIAVTDHGSGIPASELRTIFEEFRQSSVTAKLGLGTGLGLAIVSKFAALQGGTVSVDSSPGAGSTFRVWLPLDARMHDTESGRHESLREV